ncbi:MAG TPA: formate dehydrogenase accessory protein FdhE [Gemmatimonadaceae bacterium]
MPTLLKSQHDVRSVRRTLVDQLLPVTALHAELEQGCELALDVPGARARLKAGQSAFDPFVVFTGAKDLPRAVQRMTSALEHAGLCGSDALARVRGVEPDVVRLGRAWIGGEPLPSDEARRLARRAVALVGNAVLRRASREVCGATTLRISDRAACPCCGGPAEFSVSGGQVRRLVCSRCDTVWRTTRRGCLGCGAEGDPAVARIPSASLGYDLTICHHCGRYLKERTVRSAPALLVERIMTAELDAAAQERGLRM